MADNRKYIAIKPTTLSTGVNVGDTTCIPSQIKDRLGNSITAMTSFGTKGFGVISPDTDKEEQFVFTGLSGGTVSGISAVTMQDPYTETSGWLKEHAAGEPIILYTNSPAFYNEFGNTQNDNTWAGVQTHSVSPIVPTGGTGTQAANHDDIAAAVTGASGTATNLVAGTTKLSVAAVSAPNPIAVGDNDPRVPTSGQTALLAAITADAAEINKLDGLTATQAQLNEAGTFFDNTDITGAEAEDLTDGGSTTLHTHSELPGHQTIALGANISSFISSTNVPVQFAFDPSYEYAYLATKVSSATTVEVGRFLMNPFARTVYSTGLNTSLSSTATGKGCGICVTATYVWVVTSVSGGTDILITRYAKDMSGAQTMTISGTAYTGDIRSVTGTDSILYVKSGTTATQMLQYTISGTTATRGSDITLNNALETFPVLFDGTSFFQQQITTFKKWAVGGGADTSESRTMGEGGSSLTNAAEDSTRAIIGIENVNTNELAIARFNWKNETTADRGYIELIRVEKI